MKKNIQLMGLRNLLLVLVQDYQKRHSNEQTLNMLKCFIGCNGADHLLNGNTVVDFVNVIASASEKARTDDEMKLIIQEMLWEGNCDIEWLLTTYFSEEGKEANFSAVLETAEGQS